ncbi:VOC family protein [Streptomyces sp. SID3343]|uniref:VOC family protein n=1 Tax=Streptomyces sp. SID3343 TaxID=2690260 RepID=UPI0031F9C133
MDVDDRLCSAGPTRERVVAAVERLTAAGATVQREDHLLGRPDHVVTVDPEGNEFCVR